MPNIIPLKCYKSFKTMKGGELLVIGGYLIKGAVTDCNKKLFVATPFTNQAIAFNSYFMTEFYHSRCLNHNYLISFIFCDEQVIKENKEINLRNKIRGATKCYITPLRLKRYFQPPWGENIRLSHLFGPSPSQRHCRAYSSPSFLLQSLLPWHFLCSLLSCPILLLRGALELGFWSPINFSNCPSLSSLSPQRASPFLQFSESLVG